MAFAQRYHDFSSGESDEYDSQPRRGGYSGRRNDGGQRFNERERRNPSWSEDRRERSFRVPMDEDEEIRGYVSYSDKVRRLTYDDLNCDEVDMDILPQRAKEVLTSNGITSLFPVQKAAYKLFVDGEELIVK